jgi:PAS domain S-box-containing protein
VNQKVETQKGQFVASRRLREQAEARLRAAHRGRFDAQADDDSRLVNELQVHQAELEMQNDELRRVQAELETSRDRFVELYDFAPVGYLTLDTEGVIQEANLTAARMLGLNRINLPGTLLNSFATAKSQDTLYLHQRGVFAAESRQTCELVLRKPDGSTFAAALESIALAGMRDGNRRCLVALSDITERRQAEAELKDGQSRLASIVNSAMDGIITTDSARRILVFNAAAEKIFGWPADQVMGLSLDRLIPERFRTEHARHVKAFHRTGSTQHLMGRQGTILGLRADGTEIPLETSISQIEAGGQTLITLILRDITERLKTEAAQRLMPRRLARAHDDERARFSRELHDQTGEEIAFFQLQVQTLMNDPSVSGPVRKRLTRLAELMRDLARNIHRIARELAPAVLNELGLDKALRHHVSEWANKTGTRTTYRSRGVGRARRVALLAETSLFRIAQEALHNVWKHARASKVSVSLQRNPGLLQLIIKDNGRGFHPQAVGKTAAEQDRLGLVGMRERAALVGGTLDIQSKPRKGTVVSVSVPLPDKE